MTFKEPSFRGIFPRWNKEPVKSESNTEREERVLQELQQEIHKEVSGLRELFDAKGASKETRMNLLRFLLGQIMDDCIDFRTHSKLKGGDPADPMRYVESSGQGFPDNRFITTFDMDKLEHSEGHTTVTIISVDYDKRTFTCKLSHYISPKESQDYRGGYTSRDMKFISEETVELAV